MTIWFDMDGTIADLYGVENWLPMLRAEDATPYAIAKPLLRLATLARMLNKLQREGAEIGIISWTAKGGTAEYHQAVADAKCEWLRKHLPSVEFDAIHIVAYGTPKIEFAISDADILFDDEVANREAWGANAYDADAILEVLRNL